MRMLVSRQTAMKFIQEVNIGPRIHSFTCLTGKNISFAIRTIWNYIPFILFKRSFVERKKMRLCGESNHFRRKFRLWWDAHFNLANVKIFQLHSKQQANNLWTHYNWVFLIQRHFKVSNTVDAKLCLTLFV